MPSRRAAVITCLIVFGGGLALFLPRIRAPERFSFDEMFYVPAARALLAGTANTNPEHPPLGKYIIAAGIKAFGDRPLGWRFFSAVGGASSLAGVYCWTLLLVRRQWLAIWAAAMTALNGLLFVMSRTAMLDVFLVMFIVWALVAFTAALEVEAAPAARCVLMAVAGALLGLAMACKWIAAPVWALAVLLAMVGGWFGGRRSTEQPSTRKSGAYWGSSSRVAVLVMIAALVVIPVVVYLASFVPLLVRLHRPVSVASLVAEQAQAFRFHTQATGSPVNKSHFYDWPLALHPQWFFYEVAPNGLTVRAVILLGNPVVMWGGVVALVVCLARGLVRPRRAEWMVVLFYAAQLLSWAMIPRPIIYYYYYFPSAMMLGPAMAVALAGTPHGMGVRLSAILAGVAAVVFALMYPLMTAMWVPTWWNPWG